MSAPNVNIDELKHELKAWEKNFKQEHGRDISKDDLKAHPEISAKYKLWRELSKKASAPSKRDEASLKASSHQGPSTPRPPRKADPSKQPKATKILSKPLPTGGDPTFVSSNPFSPVKRRPIGNDRDQSPSRVTQSRSSKVATSSASRLLFATSEEPPNPFAPSTSKAPGSHMFASPSKSSRKLSTSPPINSSSGSSNTASTATYVASDYAYADSPKKLQSIIQAATSLVRDTPRTKSRKRLRGEDVPFTPGDKRRRVYSRRNPLDAPNELDEDEEIELSPVKPAQLGPKGKAFKPVFEEGVPSTKPQTLLFFAGGTKKRNNPNQRLQSISNSLHKALDSARATPTTEETTSDPDRDDSRSSSKRPFDEMENDERGGPSGSQLRVVEDVAVLPPTIANPYGLRPPSPIVESGKGKGKPKWGERKKGKLTAADDDLPPNQDEEPEEEIVVKDVDLADLASRSRPTTNVSEDDVPLDDPEDRYRLKFLNQPFQSAEPIDEEEVLSVELPDEMRRVLHIKSPSKHPRSNDIAQGIFQGELPPDKLKGQQIWGVGELDAASSNEEGDWDEAPEGWGCNVEM
ncbi:hypothetical protein FRB99_006674 [Tulasnella sp. 403]|nr:hypothetical protein FRB99_006674 [Tulasnella sp. 403]